MQVFCTQCTYNLDLRQLTEEESDTDYALLQNTVERHSHSNHYCMRNGKCRFDFARKLRGSTVIVFTEQKDRKVRAHIRAATNYGWLNRNCRVSTQYWRANTDLSVLVDSGKVLDYMVKYVTKGEKSTPSGEKVMSEILRSADSDDPMARIIRQIMMRNRPDRDKGKPEIAHYLLQLPIVTTDVSFIRINLDSNRARRVNLNPDNAEYEEGRAPRELKFSIEDAYSRRMNEGIWEPSCIQPVFLETMTLEHFAQRFKVSKRSKICNHTRDFLPTQVSRSCWSIVSSILHVCSHQMETMDWRQKQCMG